MAIEAPFVKESLIKTVESRLKEPRLSLEAFLEKDLGPKDHEYQPLTLKGRYLHDQEAHLLGRTHNGQVVYHIVTPFLLESGTILLIDRGWVPAKISAKDSHIERPTGYLEENAYIRSQSSVNFFTPDNRYEEGEIYSILPREYAKAKSMTTLLPFFAVREGVSEGYPHSKKTALPKMRNNHLVYAITWYSLALALIVIYILFVRQKLYRTGGSTGGYTSGYRSHKNSLPPC